MNIEYLCNTNGILYKLFKYLRTSAQHFSFLLLIFKSTRPFDLQTTILNPIMYEISTKSLEPMLITFFLSSFLYLYHCHIAHMDNVLSNDGKVELRSYIHFLSWVIKTQPRKPFLVVECFRFLACLYEVCFKSKRT